MHTSEPLFRNVDDRGPVDVEAHRRAARGSLRGVFFLHVLSVCAERQVAVPAARTRYLAFREYPMLDYLDLLVEAAPKLHPERPLRGALRALGQTVYPMFVETALGRVMRAFTGASYKNVVEAAPRAYATATSEASVDVEALSDHRAVVVMRNLPVFPESYLAGVWQGALPSCQSVGDVRVAMTSPLEARFELSWRRADDAVTRSMSMG